MNGNADKCRPMLHDEGISRWGSTSLFSCIAYHANALSHPHDADSEGRMIRHHFLIYTNSAFLWSAKLHCKYIRKRKWRVKLSTYCWHHCKLWRAHYSHFAGWNVLPNLGSTRCSGWCSYEREKKVVYKVIKTIKKILWYYTDAIQNMFNKAISVEQTHKEAMKRRVTPTNANTTI